MGQFLNGLTTFDGSYFHLSSTVFRVASGLTHFVLSYPYQLIVVIQFLNGLTYVDLIYPYHLIIMIQFLNGLILFLCDCYCQSSIHGRAITIMDPSESVTPNP